jgi:hypothetical protein
MTKKKKTKKHAIAKHKNGTSATIVVLWVLRLELDSKVDVESNQSLYSSLV